MCCIGFAMEQCGNEDITGYSTPSNILRPTEESYPFVTEFGLNTPLSIKAIGINDDKTTTVEEKKKALKKLFNDHGIQIIFK